MDLAAANKLHRDGRLADAETAYRALLKAAPRDVNATFLLGIVLAQLGRHAEAIDRLREAARLAPTSPQVLGNLAGVLGSAGRHAEAVEVLASVLRLRPDYAEGHENLGVALEHLGRLTEAEAAHREAIRLRPLFPEAHCNLGNVLHKLGRNEPALAEYHRAVELGHAQACRNLAGALGGLGRAEEASACYRRLVELRPDDPAAGSEFLLSLHHLDSVTPDRMFQEHLRWAKRFAEPLYPAADRHTGRRGGPGSGEGGRLRIGYVSPDFREYPAAHFFLPVLENHDRAKFEVFCYSDVSRPDAITERLRALAENWREIATLPDVEVDGLIRRDRIDILVDLAGHMFNPRLLLFARKPAPVQATYIGYPNTTGLRTMDFRITDSWHDGHDEPRLSGSGGASTASLTLAARSEARSEDRCESVRNEPENNSVAWPSRLCLESKTQARTPMLQKTPRPGADPAGAFECTPGRAVSPLAASQIGEAGMPCVGTGAQPICDAASGGVVASETDAGPQRGEPVRNEPGNFSLFNSAIFLIKAARLPAMENASPEALFVMPITEGPASGTAPELPPAPPRLRRANREQVVISPCSLEELLEPDHPARTVWALVTSWDLSRFLAVIRARGEAPGRAAIDPLILVSLWLYAYVQGVSNGRELERLCESHDAYRWICGGVPVNYHTLNDFRVNNQEAIDDLLTQMITALTSQDLVIVKTTSNDGTRQRASAGRASFKTRETIEEHLAEARAHVEAMKRQAQDPNASLQRQRAAERAARERQERLEKALQEVKKIADAKAEQKEKPSKHQPAKASTTDPEARQMRMPGGGTAPAFNVQFAVAVEGRAIVGVEVTNDGSDVHQSEPMREQVERRTGQKVENMLEDGGFIGLDNIDAAAQAGTTIYAPVPKPKKEDVDRHQPKRGDSEAVAEWRVRMGTEAAKALYKHRASTVETANAECKTYRGLDQFLVRGIDKVRCVALWSALAYNFVHFGRQLIA